MGGKARGIFGTVLALAALAVSAGWAAPLLTKAAGIYFMGASVVYGAWSARDARKKAEAASRNKLLEDRKTTVRGGTFPKSFVYGFQFMGGVIVFVRESRSKADPYFWMVIALPIAHRIHDIPAMWFGDEQVTPLDAQGHSQNPRFSRQILGNVVIPHGVVGPSRTVSVQLKPEHQGIEKSSVVAIDENSLMLNIITHVAARAPVDYDERGQPIWGPEGPPTTPPPDYTYLPVDYDDWGRPIYAPGVTGPKASTPVYSSANDSGQFSEVNVPVKVVPGTTDQILIDYPPGTTYWLSYTYFFYESLVRVETFLGGPENEVAHQGLIHASGGVFGPPGPPGSNDPGFPRWSQNSKLRGVPYTLWRINPDPNIFPNGLENITFVVAGKPDVLDTRNGNVWLSDNPMLVARDYAISQCGVLPQDIDIAEFNEHVNICDEAVPIPGFPNEIPTHAQTPQEKLLVPPYSELNPHERRYKCSISLSTEAKPLDNLAAILSSCDGSAVFSGASFDLRVGVFEEPTYQFDESDFVSPPTVVVTPPTSENFNSVRGRYQNYRKFTWPLTELPGHTSWYYMQQDKNIPEVREFDLRGTYTAAMGQRLIKQMLHRSRQSLRCQAVFNIKAICLSPEMTIFLTVKSLGWDMKVFRIKSIRAASIDTFEVDMQEDVPDVYQYDYNETRFDPAPNTTLPDIRLVPKIQGLTLITSQAAATFGLDGELHAQCLVQWSPIQDAMVLHGGYIEVKYKNAWETEFTHSPRLSPYATNFRFPINRNDFIAVHVRAANRYVQGPWELQTKHALDAPSKFLIGENLIRNPSFYPTAVGNDQICDGWSLNPLAQQWWGAPSNVFYDEFGLVPPYQRIFQLRYLSQTVPVLGDGDWAGGYAGWLLQAKANPGGFPYLGRIRTLAIPVIPGQRYCLYVFAYTWPTGNAVAALEVAWRDKDSNVIRRDLVSYLTPQAPPDWQKWKPPTSTGPNANDMTRMGGFVVPPTNAVVASIFFEAKKWSWQNGEPDPVIIWYHPMFTPAAETQTDFPIWRAN